VFPGSGLVFESAAPSPINGPVEAVPVTMPALRVGEIGEPATGFPINGSVDDPVRMPALFAGAPVPDAPAVPERIPPLFGDTVPVVVSETTADPVPDRIPAVTTEAPSCASAAGMISISPRTGTDILQVKVEKCGHVDGALFTNKFEARGSSGPIQVALSCTDYHDIARRVDSQAIID
jgi:hypothetical protein